MKRIKLAAVGVFVVFALWATGSRFVSPTVSGQGLTAPIGVTASDGDYTDKVGVHWHAVRGATSYQILRSTTNNSATAAQVGTTQANFFFDSSVIVGQQYFFWVKAVGPSSTSDFSVSDAGGSLFGNQPGPNRALEPPPPPPPGNPLTASKVTLGKILFWDEQLSSTDTVACGTCHIPAHGGSDPRTAATNPSSRNPGPDLVFNTPDDIIGSPGVSRTNAAGLYEWSPSYGLNLQVTPRKANSNINAAYFPQRLFWDGRADGQFRDPITNNILLNGGAALESQAAGPPASDVEMAHAGRNWTDAAAKIAASRPLALSPTLTPQLEDWIGGRPYSELFTEAFGTSDITPARIAMAIASYERTQFSDRTPLDLSNTGIQPLTAAEQRGQGVFADGNCVACHASNLLQDNVFHFIGVRPQNEDLGRFTVTNAAVDRGAFRTPSLRNVGLRAPYMHNGGLATLADVVEFYNRGADFPGAPNFPADRIHPLNLSPPQKADLIAFLGRPLIDPRVANETIPFDRPALYSTSNRVPVLTGVGTNGTGARLPQAIAIEPPLVGNQNFSVAVSNALGGEKAVLVIDDNDPGNTSTVPAFGSFARIAVQLGGTGAGNGFGSATVQIPDLPYYVGRTFYGRWYVTDAGAAGGVAVSQAFRFTVFGSASAATAQAPFDYDGDGKTDVSLWRQSNGTWYVGRSGLGDMYVQPWGLTGDTIAPADYDGDGKTDLAVRRPSDNNFYVFNSSNSTVEVRNFGIAGDVAVPADYNGDGKADVSVWRPSNGTWYLSLSGSGIFYVMPWGLGSDKPAPGDFDGDGKTDLAVFRPSDGRWYTFSAATGIITVTEWGLNGDRPVQGDYNGDGRTDFAVYRPSNNTWYRQNSNDGAIASTQFGLPNDFPVPGDYDGDGKMDIGVWRPSDATWYVNRSGSGAFTQTFGINGDTPTPSAFVF